jgi:hypothetical protein
MPRGYPIEETHPSYRSTSGNHWTVRDGHCRACVTTRLWKERGKGGVHESWVDGTP